MSKAIDLSHVYSLRNDFTIIGLTGQIGSGCSEVAEQLSRGFRFSDFEDPLEVGVDSKTFEFKHNSYRKYRIAYNYAKYNDNFKGYSRINYKDILVIFLLQNSFDDFIDFLKSTELSKALETIVPNASFDEEVQMLFELKTQFNTLSEKYRLIDIKNIKVNNNWNDLYNFFFNSEFLSFCDAIYSILRKNSRVKRNKLLQIISTNLRSSGNPFEFSEPTAVKIFTIVELVNYGYKKPPQVFRYKGRRTNSNCNR